ncbi:MAG: DUF4236 domain-containing protein [Moraxellaceae bacterium]|nr:MAG: DUF4236 domain-containing protein [Moraxellaceae bacterium]
MGFRFRKSIKILPGVKVNITQKGVSSVSVGGKGLTVNQGKRGTRVTASLRGSGLSYSQQLGKPKPRAGTNSKALSQHNAAQPPSQPSAMISPRLIVTLLIIGFILWLIF